MLIGACNPIACAIRTVSSYSTPTTACLRYTGCKARTEFCTIDGLAHEWPGHPRPDGTSPVQPDTNIDGTAFIFDRFAAMVGVDGVAAGTNATGTTNITRKPTLATEY